MFHGEAGFEQWERGYKGNYPVHAYAAIGGGRGHDRIVRTRWFKDRGYTTDSIIHRTAFVADTAEIGAACHILAMSATCASVRLGTAVIINTKASVDHDCVLGDGVHIGPGATLAGEVIVRDFAFIGAGATVLPCIQIGRDAIVGAGSVVTHDVPDGTIVVGNPAHFYKKNRV